MFLPRKSYWQKENLVQNLATGKRSREIINFSLYYMRKHLLGPQWQQVFGEESALDLDGGEPGAQAWSEAPYADRI